MKRGEKGFSLFEIIIAISLIALGVIIATILSRTYRSSSQTARISRLRSNGDLAINQISETIRNAEAVICYGPATGNKTRIVVRSLSGVYTKFRFVPYTIVNQIITNNGYIAKQENLNPADMASFCSDTPLSNPPEVAITNKELESGVNITEGRFTDIGGTNGKDLVTVSFKVNPSAYVGGVGSSEIVSVLTTVQVR